MTLKFTDIDIKQLKYATRSGYVIGFVSIVPTSLILGTLMNNIGFGSISIYISSGFLTGLFVMWIINRKFWTDLWNGQKDIISKKVQDKNSIVSYEAGSSVGYSFTGKRSAHFLDQKGHDIYNLIVDNYRYRVEKELYDSIDIGDEVELHYAQKSRFLLSIDKKGNARL
jgi:hypothetical protein